MRATCKMSAARRGAWALTATLAMMVSGCLNVAEDRARVDATIGQSSIDALRVEVDQGLAHVRSLRPGELTLWGQAPALRVRLTGGQGHDGVWTVRLRNAMSDAALRVTDSSGQDVSFSARSSSLATVKVWELPPLVEGQEVTLDIAPPDIDDMRTWRFAIYADVQERIDGVQDIYRRMAADPSLRFALISGDLTESGTPAQLERFQREMETLPFPCFSTLGNHELGDGDHTFQNFFGRGNFSFEFRGARFTLLDSASATIARRVYGWLEDDWLPAGRDKLHLAIMHIPPLDPSGRRNGAFASRAEANKLLKMFADADVDMTVYGHVHTYHAFSNAGIDAFISGGGGAIPQRLDGVGRHYMKVEVEPDAQRFTAAVVRISPEE